MSQASLQRDSSMKIVQVDIPSLDALKPIKGIPLLKNMNRSIVHKNRHIHYLLRKIFKLAISKMSWTKACFPLFSEPQNKKYPLKVVREMQNGIYPQIIIRTLTHKISTIQDMRGLMTFKRITKTINGFLYSLQFQANPLREDSKEHKKPYEKMALDSQDNFIFERTEYQISNNAYCQQTMTLECIMLQHLKAFSDSQLLKKTFDEHSIHQHLELLKFIQKTCPGSQNDYALFEDEDFWHHLVYLENITSSNSLPNLKKASTLLRIYSFALKYRLIKSQKANILIWLLINLTDANPDLTSIETSPNSKTKRSQLFSYNLQLHRYQEVFRDLNKELLSQFQKKLARYNHCSFYLLKKFLEQVYTRVSANSEIETLAPMTLRIVCTMIKHLCFAFESALSKFGIGAPKSFVSRLPSTRSALCQEVVDHWKLWKSILLCYYDYLRVIESSLLLKLSYLFEMETGFFLLELLRDPLSFLVNKKAQHINWELINGLIEFYSELKVTALSSSKLLKQEYSLMTILGATLMVKNYEKKEETATRWSIFTKFDKDNIINEQNAVGFITEVERIITEKLIQHHKEIFSDCLYLRSKSNGPSLTR